MASTSGSKKTLDKWDDPETSKSEEVLNNMSNDEMISRITSLEKSVKGLENEVKSMKREMMRISPKKQASNENIKENTDAEDVDVADLRAQRNREDDDITIIDILTNKRLFVECVINVIIMYSAVQIVVLTGFYFLDREQFDDYVMKIQKILVNVLAFVKNCLYF